MIQYSCNPATGETLAKYDIQSASNVDIRLSAAITAQVGWRQKSLSQRAELLRSMADVLRTYKGEYARIITLEVGKPIREAEAEIEKCALNCDFYAERAPEWLADTKVEIEDLESFVVYDPLGIVLAIMPWNYPFWQVFRFLAPALAAGNGAVLKHAANVPQCALAIESALGEAGCPKGLFTSLLIETELVENLIKDPRIAAVTLTGSTAVGKIVASQAGAALKKQVLELGGSDPFIIFEDADIEKAAIGAVKGRFLNAGQSCVNAKRFIVVDKVADAFVTAFKAKTEALVMGDPMLPETDIGPMARANLRDQLHSQVQRTLAAGATLVLGGAPVEGRGFYYAPTILDNVTLDMAAFYEEIFGPVAAIIRVPDEDTAIRYANQTEFGLGASLWTENKVSAKKIARQIDAGAVFINKIVASDPHLPFGGIKQSGYGRELADVGLREFVNIKTLCVEKTKGRKL
nr:NAD-dependent succinate-semialdehyde dehydrogenase [Kordiimonas pumila]